MLAVGVTIMKLVKTGIIITTTLLTMIASLGSTGIHFTNGVLPAVENLPFSDDFNYASISAMVSAGWAQCGGPTPASYYSVSNSLLTLQNDGQAGAAMCWTIQSGATDWTVGERVEATGGLASVTITAVTSYEVNTVLSHHTYRFVADQYTIPAAPNGGQYYLVRDNAVIVTVPGYNPQLNVWHSLRLNMRGNLLTMFFDGAQIGTPYSEPDGTTLTAVNMLATYQATDTFEYVGAADTAFPNGISPFKDDFNYATVNGMLGAGWTNCGNGSPSQYTVGNSVLTLQNDGTNGAGMCWNNLPPGVPNWNASARVEWSGGIYGSIQVDVRTTSHEYRFDADGYTSYRQYLLIRDGAIIVYGPSYSPQLNTWHVLQLNMLNTVITMYFDGLPVGSQYTEP